jgi:lipoate-protein ligase A
MAYPPATWRLLLSPSAAGAANMAVDEAILNAVAEGGAPATLRFFRWAPPCLSLGYAQPLAEVDRARLRARGWDIVRRPTGGRAILHTDELTYSVVAPLAEPRVAGGVVESYRQLSAGLMRGLELLGLPVRADKEYDPPEGGPPKGPVCFEVPSNYEITFGSRKLLGSAQLRRQGVMLQHGTLPLAGDMARICEVLRFNSDDERSQAQARVRARAATAGEALGREVSWDEAAAALGRGFGEALELTLAPGGLLEQEQGAAQQLRAGKYAAEAWTARL